MAKRAGKGKLEDEISRLYTLTLDEFTAERDAVAKRLRGDGDREGAAEIKALKKPNLPAWAINQAVRGDPAATKALVDAGERLNEAQTAALEGGDADALREAMTDQAAAVDRMMGAVEKALDGAGHGAAIVDRARETLRAVAGDEELRAQFSAGRVVRDREAVGFGGAQVTPRGAARKPKRTASASDVRRRDAQKEEKRSARLLEAAVKRVDAASRRLDRTQQAVDAARADHDEAERERAEREAELADARAVVEELRE